MGGAPPTLLEKRDNNNKAIGRRKPDDSYPTTVKLGGKRKIQAEGDIWESKDKMPGQKGRKSIGTAEGSQAKVRKYSKLHAHEAVKVNVATYSGGGSQ